MYTHHKRDRYTVAIHKDKTCNTHAKYIKTRLTKRAHTEDTCAYQNMHIQHKRRMCSPIQDTHKRPTYIMCVDTTCDSCKIHKNYMNTRSLHTKYINIYKNIYSYCSCTQSTNDPVYTHNTLTLTKHTKCSTHTQEHTHTIHTKCALTQIHCSAPRALN